MFHRALITTAAVTLAASATALIPTSSAHAVTGCGGPYACTWFYYKDATIGSQIVGARGYKCDGEYFQQGDITSPFWRFGTFSC